MICSVVVTSSDKIVFYKIEDIFRVVGKYENAKMINCNFISLLMQQWLLELSHVFTGCETNSVKVKLILAVNLYNFNVRK